ncbi:MAG: RHS repeat-associated core domain-containing protein [Microgenomates group bacterium]
MQASYRYDYLGRQVSRALTGGLTIHSVFDSAGNRIAEYNQTTGALIREYIWLDGAPIAVVEGGVIYYIRTDHIGRPIFATNAAGAKVWTASYLPFGGVRTSTGVPLALRFPGQWFQSESGLHQNWMRDYDPTTGRYIQADPLGLVDGASVYGYVKGNPVNWVDPRGEEVRVYSSDAFGLGAGLNHVYVHSDTCDCGVGSNGSSGYRKGDGVGAMSTSDGSLHVEVPLGMTDQAFIASLGASPNFNNLLYFPFINDCHNDLERAFEHNGYVYPGTPNGRFDTDDIFSETISIWRKGIVDFFTPSYFP